jgi:hypothetical protein
MAFVDHLSSSPVIPFPLIEREENSGKDHSFSYLLAFASRGGVETMPSSPKPQASRNRHCEALAPHMI